MPGAGNAAAFKPISNLATMQLKEIGRQDRPSFLEGATATKADAVHPKAHLDGSRVDDPARRLAAEYIYNADDIGGSGGGLPFLIFGEETGRPAAR